MLDEFQIDSSMISDFLVSYNDSTMDLNNIFVP